MATDGPDNDDRSPGDRSPEGGSAEPRSAEDGSAEPRSAEHGSAEDGGSFEDGGRIHGDHPFLPPPHERNPVRRLRGRLTAPVTLWTAAVRERRAGLPVSAVMVADGEPGKVLGLLDDNSELWPLIEDGGRFAVSVLRWEHRSLADAFAGLMPAPGGTFRLSEWTDTDWGPVPSSVQTWAGCRLLSSRPFGWALAVEGELEHVVLGDETDPLLHRRGRYFTVPDGS
ncbi:MAG TPA: flavin reductase family protein [Actinopolymorphaceae bacterium]|nr:flavin reductase family protein [Actinopolymorphaceae bacterium]